MIRLGDLRVHVISDGGFALDGGAMFGVVPRPLWERAHPPDARNRVALGLNTVLIESGSRRVLVDTGLGGKWGERERDLYALAGGRLLDGLRAVGVAAEDVDVVVNSHLHFDHAGGNTRLSDGKLVPTFPKARYVVQMGEWEDATHPNERNRASYLEENFVPLAEARQLDAVQGEVEIAPGVRVVPAGGHTAYHQMVVVEGGGQRLVVPTDLVPTASHLALAWITGYDLFPMGTLEAKRRILKGAAEEGWSVVFYHDAGVPVGRVARQKDRYVLREVTP